MSKTGCGCGCLGKEKTDKKESQNKSEKQEKK